MTDCDLVFQYLLGRPGWHNAVDMMLELKPGAVNWALRSRISDLNRRGMPSHPTGFRIESRLGENGCAEYRLQEIPSGELRLAI